VLDDTDPPFVVGALAGQVSAVAPSGGPRSFTVDFLFATPACAFAAQKGDLLLTPDHVAEVQKSSAPAAGAQRSRCACCCARRPEHVLACGGRVARALDGRGDRAAGVLRHPAAGARQLPAERGLDRDQATDLLQRADGSAACGPSTASVWLW